MNPIQYYLDEKVQFSGFKLGKMTKQCICWKVIFLQVLFMAPSGGHIDVLPLYKMYGNWGCKTTIDYDTQLKSFLQCNKIVETKIWILLPEKRTTLT